MAEIHLIEKPHAVHPVDVTKKEVLKVEHATKKARTPAQLAAVAKMRAAREAKKEEPKAPHEPVHHEPKKAAEKRALPGIVLKIEFDIYARWTPLGDGTWRVECNAYDQNEVVPGPDAAHDGTWLVIEGLFFDQFGHPYYDGTPLAPVEKDENL